MSHAVMRFRRDLRLEDNPAWAAACDSDSVTALYVLDPRLTALSPFSRRRDAAVNDAVDALGVSVHRDWGHLAQPPGSVVTRAGHVSRVFTPCFRAWVGRPLRPPALRSVDPSLTADPGEGIPDHDSADEAGPDALAERLARADALTSTPGWRAGPAIRSSMPRCGH